MILSQADSQAGGKERAGKGANPTGGARLARNSSAAAAGIVAPVAAAVKEARNR